MKYREHPVFTRNKNLLKFYIDSYLGGDNYITVDHLHQFGREPDNAFKKRLKRAYYLNYVFTVVRIYTQYVCGSVTRLAPEGSSWKEAFETKFFPNVTGDGLDLPSFFREGCDKTSAYGLQGVLIDGTKLIKNRPLVATAVADATNPPVLRKVEATDVIDWSVDSLGNLNWVLLKTTVTTDSNPFVPRIVKGGLELWTRVGVWYYEEILKNGEVVSGDATDNALVELMQDEKEYKLVNQIQYNYQNKVPFVWIKNSRTLLDGIPASMIKDISLINKAIFNYTSLRDNILYYQTFSVLALPKSGGDDTEYQRMIGESNYLEFDGQSAHAPNYLTPPSGPAETLSKVILECIQEIFRLAVLEKTGNDKNSEYSTAYGRMVDSQDTESALVEKAELMESAENEVAVMYNLVRGETSGEPYWVASYPKKFDVKQLSQDLADAIQEDTLGMGEAYMIKLKEKIARKRFPDLTTEEMEEIYAGIAEATKLMEELKDPATSGGLKNADMGTTRPTNSVNGVGNTA